MIVFWRYEIVWRHTARAVARPAVTNATPAPQKKTSSASSGDHKPVSQAHAYRIQAPIVTRWKTPTNSSAVEWSARSSSLS